MNSVEASFDTVSSILKGDLALTNMACAPAPMQQNQRLLTILHKGQNFAILGEELTIINIEGRTITARRDSTIG